MSLLPQLRRALRHLRIFRLAGIAGLWLGVGLALAHGQTTDYVYYSTDPNNNSDATNYRYDTIGGGWAVSYSDNYFGTDDWSSLDAAPDSPGVLEGGDNWDTSYSYGDYSYAYDSVSHAWYISIYFDGLGYGYGPSFDPNSDTDFTYYYNSNGGTRYAYDNPSGQWANYVITDDLDGTGIWSPQAGPPASPGIIIGGDNWTYSQVGDSQYAYDSVAGVFFVYNPATTGWAPAATDYDNYYAGDLDTHYRYDNLHGTWFVDANGNGDWQLLNSAPSTPGILTGGANWVDHTVDGNQYAYDSDILTWYAYNSGTGAWAVTSDPTAGGAHPGSLSVGSLLVDGSLSTAGAFFVGHDFSIGGTVFDPSGLAAVSDGNGNFLGWQLIYGGLQNGADASFSSLAVSDSINATNLSGNVSVAGSVRLGLWNNGAQNLPGVSFGGATLSAASPAVTWHWQQNGLAAAVDQMTFDYSANLNLFSRAGSTLHALSLSPGALALRTQVNSNTAQSIGLVNDTVAASATALNLGGGINLDSAARSLRLGNATITGSDGAGALVFTDANSGHTISISPVNESIAFSGGFSLAGNSTSSILQTGGTAVALGGNASASGNHSVALAGGAAAGVLSVAVGGNSTAAGNGALALGTDGTAAGNGSISLNGGTASANNAIAIGLGTTAQTWGATVVGHYNAPISGNATALSPTDPAFVVGIGANATNPANALVIYNNGDAVANGNLTLTHPAYVSPTSATQPQEIQVNGATLFNAGATLNGAVIIATPQGLPMGAFGN